MTTRALDTSGNKDQYGADTCSDDDAACIQRCTENPDMCYEEYIVANDYLGSTFFLALFLGCIILLSQAVDAILQLTPRSWLDEYGLLQRLVLPGTLRQERVGHQAATLRIKQFLTNALGVFNDSSSTSSSNSDKITRRATNALERFLLSPVKTESVGGVLWAWKRIWDGTIFSQEGIWLNSRLLACNFSQLMIFVVLIWFARVFIYKQRDLFYTEEELDNQQEINMLDEMIFNGNFTDGLGEDYLNFFNCTLNYIPTEAAEAGFMGGSLVFIPYLVGRFGSYEVAKVELSVCYEAYPSVAEYLNTSFEVWTDTDDLKNLVANFNVTASLYIAAAWFGLIGGFIAVTYIAVILIPSFVSTVMKYRSGVEPTLTSPEFLRYRYAMDTTTMLLGSAFWGCFFTAIGTFLVVFFLVSCPIYFSCLIY